ncbi:hypothetical protein RRU94_06470 [Domibacillus sp. DTU_2020_1001157_1_SI_ALB_TIR_016]|uniref:hypothetical protein n=1 Tax=Domibacillus sp. DTU_2020_1001157_1_SI_ALB_TIR_016 TaxID=3077789 RepID=UPI0028ED743E|nr:hypothetical protein [Domibacillus sp. DTU_2020_1001157_1_SI_ALB_TIR_016]WNS78107.1 hypothetical protein RRU94_06470 [Domibacillus sp. DTU_2020_1001157_1_SI_ALB_TIR_016]
MDTKGKDLVEQLRKMNEKSLQNLVKDSRQKRNNKKLKEDFKKSQAKALEELKKKNAPATDSKNTSLQDMLDKLF